MKKKLSYKITLIITKIKRFIRQLNYKINLMVTKIRICLRQISLFKNIKIFLFFFFFSFFGLFFSVFFFENIFINHFFFEGIFEHFKNFVSSFFPIKTSQGSCDIDVNKKSEVKTSNNSSQSIFKKFWNKLKDLFPILRNDDDDVDINGDGNLEEKKLMTLDNLLDENTRNECLNKFFTNYKDISKNLLDWEITTLESKVSEGFIIKRKADNIFYILGRPAHDLNQHDNNIKKLLKYPLASLEDVLEVNKSIDNKLYYKLRLPIFKNLTIVDIEKRKNSSYSTLIKTKFKLILMYRNKCLEEAISVAKMYEEKVDLNSAKFQRWEKNYNNIRYENKAFYIECLNNPHLNEALYAKNIQLKEYQNLIFPFLPHFSPYELHLFSKSLKNVNNLNHLNNKDFFNEFTGNHILQSKLESYYPFMKEGGVTITNLEKFKVDVEKNNALFLFGTNYSKNFISTLRDDLKDLDDFTNELSMVKHIFSLTENNKFKNLYFKIDYINTRLFFFSEIQDVILSDEMDEKYSNKIKKLPKIQKINLTRFSDSKNN